MADFQAFPARHPSPELYGPFFVYYECNNTSDPDGVTQSAKILRDTSVGAQVTRADTGDHVVHLGREYRAVYARAHLEEAGTNVAQVTGRTASTVLVSTLDNDLAVDDLTDKTVCVEIWVQV